MRLFYKLDHDVNRYKSFEYDSKILGRLDRLYKGVQVGKGWKPISLKWYPGLKNGDFPHSSMSRHCPIFSLRAWETLQPLIGNATQTIPVECSGSISYVLVNVFEVIDCLDQERSEFKRYENGAVSSIERYAFRDSLVRGKHIFRVPEEPERVIVSEEFKASVEAAGLVGLDFRPLPGTDAPKQRKAKKRAAPRKTAKKAKRKTVRPKRTTAKVKTSRGTVTLRRSLPPVAEAELKALEKSLKVKLPKPYRDFLLTCNGGEPIPDGFRKPDEEEPCAYVQEFLEISDQEGSSLMECFRLFKQEHNWLPKSLMPIANDPGGSLFCVSVSGRDKGAVYFWDHEQAGERELKNDNDYGDVTLLAADFDAFLSGFAKRPRKKR